MKELAFEIETIMVQSHQRTLKGTWTCNDGIYLVMGKRIPKRRYRGTYRYKVRRIYAYHSLDVVEELTRLCSEQLTKSLGDVL